MPSEDKGREFKAPVLVPWPNPSPSASDTATPLGTLSILPRELRDEIYWYLHDYEYWLRDSVYKPRCKWWSRDFGSYRLPMATLLSKAIRQEFLAALCGKAVFRLHDFTGTRGCITKREHIPFINQILNVDTVVSLICGCAHGRCQHDNSEAWVKPIEFFRGTEVLRNSCSIEIYSRSQKWTSDVQLPLITVMKGLTGFQIVTLQLSSVTIGHGASPRNMAKIFRSALEPSLGPSIFNEDYDKGRPWKLTFRPRDYLANKNKVKAISSRSGDEGN